MDQPVPDFNLRVIPAEEPIADEVAEVLKEGTLGTMTTKGAQKNQMHHKAAMSTVQSSY